MSRGISSSIFETKIIDKTPRSCSLPDGLLADDGGADLCRKVSSEEIFGKSAAALEGAGPTGLRILSQERTAASHEGSAGGDPIAKQ